MPGLLAKRQRRKAEIPTTSMADIAFLLLVFFLIATTIDIDSGIEMTLPPRVDAQRPPPPVLDRNLLRVLVAAGGEVAVDGRPVSLPQVRQEVRRHVLNQGRDPRYATDATRAIVSVQTDRATSYAAYIAVVDEVWMAYREMWDAEARRLGYRDYETYRAALGAGDENEIRQRIRANISLAEPEAPAATE